MRAEEKKLLLDVSEACQSIEQRCAEHTFEEYCSDRWFRRTVEREFEIIGEALRACLKKTIETRCGRFGVPPLGGFCAAPPKGGTPNRVFKQALNRLDRLAPAVAARVTSLRHIVDFRNRIIHGYDSVDDVIV
jgi:uncharacterized protein with HEPN domain